MSGSEAVLVERCVGRKRSRFDKAEAAVLEDCSAVGNTEQVIQYYCFSRKSTLPKLKSGKIAWHLVVICFHCTGYCS